ncbi:helix-turn-helix domain-containing protein [Virgibacillus phasianinus]|nr:helix-turn-helix transcriptional regulator [Virgibacillus phasianinus]
MIEGRIIKYYRQKSGISQEKLGQGICSVTHLSKIERGITEYSSEIISLLSVRLGINMKTEIKRYQQTKVLLEKWFDALVMQKKEEIFRLKEEIENEDLINLPENLNLYKLLLARCYLFTNNVKEAYSIITYIEKRQLAMLSPEEKNLLKHVFGIYYFLTGQFKACITTMENIDNGQYHNDEYYYHLALAHHSVHSNIQAYYFASKALEYFQKTLNILRIIDTEMVMLIQLNAREHHDYKITLEKYRKLIQLCDTCNDQQRRLKLFHNLGFENMRRGYYQEASRLFNKAMSFINEDDQQYLTTLDVYINSCFKGQLLSDEKLLDLIQHGLRLAIDKKDERYILFQLHIFSIRQQEDNYYHYLEETVIPHFRETGYYMMVEHYEKKLFYYLVNRKKTSKALDLSKSIVSSKKSFYDVDINVNT